MQIIRVLLIMVYGKSKDVIKQCLISKQREVDDGCVRYAY